MPFVTLDQLPAARVQWLWPGRLPIEQLSIFDGDPGIGKSLLTLDLAARVTTGEPFPDGTGGGKPAAVVILNAEDSGRTVIRSRLRAAGADFARVQVFERSAGEAFLRLPGHLSRLEDAIASRGARYVVIDPIMSYLDKNVQASSDQSVRAALAPLADLAARHHCAIQLIRHLNKGGGKNALYRGLCSIGFIASCRIAWLAARDPHLGNRYVLTQPKVNLDAPQSSLAYGIEADASGEARIVWHGKSTFNDEDVLSAAPSRRRVLMRAQEFLLDFLRAGPRSTRDIWEAAQQHGIAQSTLNRAREVLKITFTRVHVGTVEQTSYWVLPSQPFTPEISDAPEADEFLRRLHDQPALRTPLDPPDRPEYVRIESDEEDDEEEGD